MTFAINQIFLGDVDRTGATTSATSPTDGGFGCSYYATGRDWTGYGYDLDHNVTTVRSVDVCTLAFGAPLDNQDDGINGNDNSWGSNVLVYAIGNVGPTLSDGETKLIAAGHWTLQIQVDGMPANDTVGVHARVFAAGPYDQGTPSFAATTDWPVLASAVQDGASIASGAVVFDNDAYVTNGTFVMRPAAVLAVPLEAQGVRAVGFVHRPVVTFSLPAKGSPSVITNGTIAGVLDPTELSNAIRSAMIAANPSWCGGLVLNAVTNVSFQAADILMDESNTAGVACDAISVGIGFNAQFVANPTKVVADPVTPAVSCPPPGSDAGTDAPRD